MSKVSQIHFEATKWPFLNKTHRFDHNLAHDNSPIIHSKKSLLNGCENNENEIIPLPNKDRLRTL